MKIEDLTKEELINRLLLLESKLKQFYNLEIDDRNEALPLLAQAIMHYLDSEEYQHLLPSLKKGKQLRFFYQKIRFLMDFIEEEL